MLYRVPGTVRYILARMDLTKYILHRQRLFLKLNSCQNIFYRVHEIFSFKIFESFVLMPIRFTSYADFWFRFRREVWDTTEQVLVLTALWLLRLFLLDLILRLTDQSLPLVRCESLFLGNLYQYLQ